MVKNANLQTAKAVKNDEFFTAFADIEAELRFYQRHFCNKTVYCNCDDPASSQFWRYFWLNFQNLGLKRLIASHCDAGKAVFASAWDKNGLQVWPLSDGDFRSAECVGLLQRADVIVTNPPFSLWREFMAALIEYQKKFIIIGPLNAVTYKSVFPLMQENRLWLGNTQVKSFLTPDAGFKQFGNTYWYTNLEHPKRRKPLTLRCFYDPALYPKYDNYEAVEVSRVVNIPCDYDGPMGVPISFLTRYCPEQFEILGLSSVVATHIPDGLPKQQKGGIRFYLKDQSGGYHRMYERLVIRRK